MSLVQGNLFIGGKGWRQLCPKEPGEGSTGKSRREKLFPPSVPPAPSSGEALASGKREYLQSPPSLSQSRQEGWIWSSESMT